MKKFMLILLLFGCVMQCFAQSNNDKAKAYYFNAEEQYQNKNYDKAIEYCEEVEKLLGNTNARLEALRVKSYYHTGQIEKAKFSLDKFLSLGADESLLKEIASYTTKIEDRKKEVEKLSQGIKPDKYDYMGEFTKDGLAIVKIGSYPNEKCGFIDKSGREITPLKYDIASSFSEGMAMVGSRNLDDKNNKVGFIDTTGKVKIAFKYDWAASFSEGLAMVMVDDKGSGFINKEGQFVISPIYDFAHSFYNGKAKVELDGREFYIDKNGNEVK